MNTSITAVITVTNSNDPTCQRLTLIERHEVVADGNSSNDIRDLIADVERRFKEMFPRGMSYTLPYTTVSIERPTDANRADRLLRQAYASGQLQGTIIGAMVQAHYGVPYTEIVAEPYSDPAAQTVSIGSQR